MQIIARKITNLTDARYFAAKDVAYLGFNLEKGTEGYLDPMYMQAMREWVEGPAITGEFSAATPLSVINEAIRFYGLNAVIVPESIRAISLESSDIIVKIGVKKGTPLPLIDANHATQKVTLLLELEDINDSWSAYIDLLNGSPLPYFLQFDAPVSELQEILPQIQPLGLCFTGGEEEAVGVKSFDEIEAFFDVLSETI